MDESTDITIQNVTLITTGPINFAGAATIHARLLCSLAMRGMDTRFVCQDKPFLFDELVRAGVKCFFPRIRSDAYHDSDAVASLAITKEVHRQALEAHIASRMVVLMGSYLFPFYQAIVLAGELLKYNKVPFRTIAVPAGSDIWQIGFEVPGLVKWLLSAPRTDFAVAYSARFVDEILTLIGVSAPFRIIPPPVDTRFFFPLGARERNQLRADLDIEEDTFVILHCSNMRPVKRLDEVIKIALEFSGVCQRRVLLLLVGPDTSYLRETMAIYGLKIDGVFPIRGKIKSLEVLAVGLQKETWCYHQISDIALNASVHDSFNTSLAESMACGVPVISSDIVGIAEFVRQYGCGYLFAYPDCALERFRMGENVILGSDSIEAAVRFMRAISENRELWQKLRSSAVTAIHENCTEDIIFAEWYKIILEAINASRSLDKNYDL